MVNEVDIRALNLKDLPSSIDIVVGSPPCTQFSYSNRGGNGNIKEGLKDIAKFLQVVDHIKPKYWATENVPRVRNVLAHHLFDPKGILRKFQHLFDSDKAFIEVFDMSEFGLPQRRKRCIAGNFPIDLLSSYSSFCPSRTLGDTLKSLNSEKIVDSIYGYRVKKSHWFDHDKETPLSKEERRLNQDNKQFHPVYNDMKFPDVLDHPVRAITATCTRISRESVIVRDLEHRNQLRRLTIRERACLQGFPATFQFHGTSYSSKLRMVGNAMPPLMAYYIGCSMREEPASELKHPHELELGSGLID